MLLFAITGAMLLSGRARPARAVPRASSCWSCPGYLLAGFAKRDGLSTEGAIKYFLLGSFSSAIFLFGLAFVWGYTGTTNVVGVAVGAAGRGVRQARSPPASRWASRS